MSGSLRELSLGKYQFRMSAGGDPASSTYRYKIALLPESQRRDVVAIIDEMSGTDEL